MVRLSRPPLVPSKHHKCIRRWLIGPVWVRAFLQQSICVFVCGVLGFTFSVGRIAYAFRALRCFETLRVCV